MMNKLKLFLVSLIGTFAFTTPAWAGPAVVPFLVLGAGVGAAAAAAGLISATIFTAAAIGAAIGAAAGALAPDILGGFLDTPDYNVTQNAQAVNDGILVNKVGTLTHIPVIYGTRKVGGPIVYMSNGGDRNKFLYLAVVLSEGEVDSIGTVFLDDIPITDERFRGKHQIERKTGASGQSASSILTAGGGGWTASHNLDGLAYVALRLTWNKIESIEDADQNPYQGVPRVTAIVRGKKVKNCASLTNSHATAYGSETVAFSANPADCILDYLRNPIYGKGLSNDRIDFPSFSTARAKYAQTVTYASLGTGPLLTCDAVIDTSRSILDNLKTFLANARSGMPYVQGRFKLKLQDTGHASDSQNSTPAIAFAVTRDHIVGGVKITANGTREHYNQVKVSFPDPANNWKVHEVVFPVLNSAEDQTLLNEDNNKRLTKDFAFNHITNQNIAGDLARTILRQSRKRKHISFKATAELHEVEVGDVISITYDLLGFSAVNYRVLSMKINADYTVDITASEHTPAEYIFDDTQVKYGATTQTKYVGGLIPGKYYFWNGSEWEEGVAPPPTANEPRLPAQITSVSSTQFRITGITEDLKRDDKSNPQVLLKVAFLMTTDVIDNTYEVILERKNKQSGFFEEILKAPPNAIQSSSSDNFFVRTYVPLDGTAQDFRLKAVFDNGDRFYTAQSTITVSQSSFKQGVII